MYYEVYLDSIFLICFCMNRYLLGLAVLCLPCTATHVDCGRERRWERWENCCRCLFPWAECPFGWHCSQSLCTEWKG